jgi:hypothetical protein
MMQRRLWFAVWIIWFSRLRIQLMQIRTQQSVKTLPQWLTFNNHFGNPKLTLRSYFLANTRSIREERARSTRGVLKRSPFFLRVSRNWIWKRDNFCYVIIMRKIASRDCNLLRLMINEWERSNFSQTFNN